MCFKLAFQQNCSAGMAAALHPRSSFKGFGHRIFSSHLVEMMSKDPSATFRCDVALSDKKQKHAWSNLEQGGRPQMVQVGCNKMASPMALSLEWFLEAAQPRTAY